MRFTALLATVTLFALTACGNGKDGAAATKVSGGNDKLAKITADLAAAQTSEAVDKVSDACSEFGLASAMSGNDPEKNAEYKKVCKVEYAKKLANVVTKNSTPEKMDVKCIAASMRLDDLIEAHVEEETMKQLNEGVKKACGL